MRIIAGKYGSRKIVAPPGTDTRPTADKTREAVFSILQTRVPGARVLDLFAGSGAMGLEALSRGARTAILVDASRAAQKAIRENIAALNARDALLLATDFRKALPMVSRPFDLIFMDPPYKDAQALADEALELLVQRRLFSLGVLITIEHAGDFTPPDGFAIMKSKRYGTSNITIIREGNDDCNA